MEDRNDVSGQSQFSHAEWTGLTHLLKERTQTQILTANFIDEYRLIGTARRSDEHVLMLWDTSDKTSDDSTPPLGLILKTKPQFIVFPGLCFPKYGLNQELPFRENHSMGIVAMTLCNPSHGTTPIGTYTIPVGALSKLPPVGKLEWSEWRHVATPIENPQTAPPHTLHILHSRVLNVYKIHDPHRSAFFLQVRDFSLRSRRQKVQDDPSAPFPSCTVQEFTLDIDDFRAEFHFTDSGILVTSVRVHVMAGVLKH